MQPERARLHQLRQPLWRRVNEVRRRLALAQEVNLLLQLLVLGEGVHPAELFVLHKLVVGVQSLLDFNAANGRRAEDYYEGRLRDTFGFCLQKCADFLVEFHVELFLERQVRCRFGFQDEIIKLFICTLNCLAC